MSTRTYSVFEVKHYLIGLLYLKGHLNLSPLGLLLDITHSNKLKVVGYKRGDLMLISSQFFFIRRSTFNILCKVHNQLTFNLHLESLYFLNNAAVLFNTLRFCRLFTDWSLKCDL